jgi:hypothetical protein
MDVKELEEFVNLIVAVTTLATLLIHILSEDEE